MSLPAGNAVFKRIANTVVRRPWWVIGGWLLALAVLVVAAPPLWMNPDRSALLPASAESIWAAELAPAAYGQPQDASAALVVTRTDGAVLTDVDQVSVERLGASLTAVGTAGDVEFTVSPARLAPNRTVALIPLAFPAAAHDRTTLDAAREIRSELADLTLGTGLHAGLTGEVGFAADSDPVLSLTDDIVAVATIVLLVLLQLMIFGSPIAALIPGVVIGLGLAIATRVIAAVAPSWQLYADHTLVSTLTLVGFALGTNYGMFLLFRLRQRMRSGDEPNQALVTAAERTGRTVAAAAVVVAVAFAALSRSELVVLASLGPSLAIVVGVLLLATLTLLPAVLGVLGPRVFWPSTAWQHTDRRPFADRLGAMVARRPGLVATASVVLLAGLGFGAVGYPIGYDLTAPVAGQESARAAAAVQSGFPAGVIGPTRVYLHSGSGAGLDPGTLAEFGGRLTMLEGVASVDPQVAGAGGGTAAFMVNLWESPTSAAALDTVHDVVRPAAQAAAPAGTTVAVGGQSAFLADVRAATERDLRLVYPLAGLLVVAALLLLLRSFVAPWYLFGSVLLTAAAGLGGSVLLFQRYLAEPGVVFALPIAMYVFVVGIAIDFCFLMVSRLREEAQAGWSPREAARRAVAGTAPMLAAAAVVVAGTVGSTLLSGVETLRQVGVAVSAGVLLAAFVTAIFLVPATTAMLGRAAWWPSRPGRRYLASEPEYDDGPVPVQLEEDVRLLRPARYPVDQLLAEGVRVVPAPADPAPAPTGAEPSMLVAGPAVSASVPADAAAPTAVPTWSPVEPAEPVDPPPPAHPNPHTPAPAPIPTSVATPAPASVEPMPGLPAQAPPTGWEAPAATNPAGRSAARIATGGRGHVVFGQVLDPNGRSLAGVPVTLAGPAGSQIDRALSGIDGSFQVVAPVAGTYLLVVAGTEHHRPIAEHVAVSDGDVHRNLALPGTSRLRGNVTHIATGEPIADARIVLLNDRGETVASTRTGPDGQYSAGDLASGTYVVTAAAAGLRPSVQLVLVPPGQDSYLGLHLGGQAQLSGTVRAPHVDSPLPGVRVVLLDPNGLVCGSTTTGPDGEYAFADVPYGSYTVTAVGYLPTSTRLELRDSTSITRDLVLGSAADASMPDQDLATV